MKANKLDSLLVTLSVLFSVDLVIPLLIISVGGQEEGGYGTPNFSSSSTGTGFSGPSGPSGSGRVVGNSILQSGVGTTSGNLQGFRQQQPQPGFKPITAGPRIIHGQNGIDPSGKEEQSKENNSDGRRNQVSGANSQLQKIFRYVSVHVAQPEPVIRRPRPTQPPQKPDTHYQIVFIKAPTPTPQDLDEIELPAAPQTKTMVYVLLKKPDISNLLKISQRPTPRPHKPEVYFIRYKQGNQQEQSNKTSSQPNSRQKPQNTESAENVSNFGGGGYETSDSGTDYNYDALNDNEFLLSNTNYQRALPDISYSPTSQYGLSV